MSTIENVISKLKMPEFTIDSVSSNDVETPGIKRMFDIALEIKDSVMLWSGPGCIAEDMIIRGYWGGKNNKGERKGVKIKHIFAHQHGQTYKGSCQIKDKDFIVKSYNEETGCIEETTVTSTYSGKKQCYLIKTINQQVEVTEEHPFLTQRGWVECKDLSLNDTVFVYPNKQAEGFKRTTSKTTIHNDEQVYVKYHAAEDTFVNIVKPVQEKIISITKTKVKDTYDLTCEKNHNFFAGNILVHNCGKSQGVMQWNQEKVVEYDKRIAEGEQVKPWNPVVCDVRLSMKEPVDMVGVPIPMTNKDGTMSTVWAVPSMWPKNDGQYSGGTIFLDEMNQGQPAILNAAFQLIQDRQLGEYKVPDGYIVIAASNPAAFNGTVSEFSLPLSNRFSHFNLKPDFEAWLNYRLNNGGNVDVMSFLKTQDSNLLYDRQGFEEKIGDLADALYTDIVITPRSWEVVERVLSLPEDKFSMLEKQLYCTGRLGIAIASKLFTFLKDKAKYQDWHEILAEGKNFKDESSESFWVVQMHCLSAISNCNDDTLCRKYVLNFIEATRNLKYNPYKIINATSLIRCKRLIGKLNVFAPTKDCEDLLMIACKAARAV